jgi:hypothetical protein
MHNKKKNGELFWELASVSPIFDGKGNIINYIKVAEDVTERKQAEDNFRHSIDESPLGIRIVNQAGKTIYVNRALLDIYEFSTLEEYINTKAIERYTEHSYQEHQERKKIRQEGRDTSDYEISIRRKNGEIRHIKVWRKEVIWNREKHFQVINQDITELKRLNEDLILAKKKAEESKAKLLAALESMSEAIFISDVNGNLINANEAYIHICGFKNREEYLEKFEDYPLLFDVYLASGEPAPIEKWAVPRALNGEIAENEIYKIHKKNTNDTWIGSYNFAPIRNRDNEIVGCVVTIRDVTEDIKKGEDLIKAKEKAEESNRLKTAFLNNMSHEIRTPLNGITGFISLLQDPEIDDKQKQQFFDIINKSSDRLIATVTDIMDISRIEAGLVQVSKTEVSVNEILEEQYRFFYHQVQSKGLELIYKPCLSEKEARFVTDKHKLEGILTNLIKNAIKFTEQGKITFACSLKKEHDIDVLEFYVKDTGIGIPANRIDAIFNRFEQADIEDTRVHQGSGLGLAIAKSYVEMLGGEITVSSEVGKGSTFTFSLPYTKQC